MQFEVSNRYCEPMCSAIVMYLRIPGGQIVQPYLRAHPLDSERGENSPEDEAAVSGKRHVMDNGMMFIFLFLTVLSGFTPPDALRI